MGCYASHERGELGAPTCDTSPLSCVSRVAPADGACAAGGFVFAFADDRGELGCSGTEGDATIFGATEICDGGRGRSYACCGASDDPLLGHWRFEGRVLGTGISLGVGEERCEVGDDAVAVSSFEPWAPTELCDDALAWPGVPLVFSVVEPDADPCVGASFVEHCDARLEGRTIVVETTSARAEMPGCLTAFGDRVARCAVLPLAVGSYEVLDEAGRRLGEVRVPSAPEPGREPRCTPIPR